jgi:glutamyl-tRNA synthetase
MMNGIRVRFAPSPTGPLHIGGVRTALYNYLLAKKYKGTFILRIEDTDQTRYIKGAEQYIIESLKWFNILPDEGPGFGGDFGPYRQSERKDLYKGYIMKMVDTGHAYIAFDTPDELEEMRVRLTAEGIHSPKYDLHIRNQMQNSLTLSEKEVADFLKEGMPYTVRIKVPENQLVEFEDQIRGNVKFQSNELDDKVLLKADGMPTYHLANIVDDHLMKISHVIRGEEWLSSTAHHVLLYRALGWEETMPVFAHLPLILKPKGKGKLSKRDGAKFGFPVFPLRWDDKQNEEVFEGFRESGFLPEAVINFLAFLGWNPGTEQEMFSLNGLVETFQLSQVGKSGARFDIDKASWFNQQYIIKSSDKELSNLIEPMIKAEGFAGSEIFLSQFCGLLKERVTTLNEFIEQGRYFFEKPVSYDEKVIRKRYKPENRVHFEAISGLLENSDGFDASILEEKIKQYMVENELGFGEIFPILRIALSGTTKGPDLFGMISLLGKEESVVRLRNSLDVFEKLILPV